MKIFKSQSGITQKVCIMGVLIFVLMIPTGMIKNMMRERSSRKRSVIHDITSKWGLEQTLSGPIISVPYKIFYEDKKGNTKSSINHFHFLPDMLDIQGSVNPEIRYRGIYKAILYNTELNFKGHFSSPNINQLNIPEENIIWEKAFLSFGITDMRGIKENIQIQFGQNKLSMEPGLFSHDVLKSGISKNILIDRNAEKTSFSFKLFLKGSQQINFIPFGKETNVKLYGEWSSPSFCGAFLPSHRKIDKNGFSATWKILHVNRNFPQIWKNSLCSVNSASFGMSLFNPVDVYQQSMRMAKYALMFFAFSFFAFFVSEIIQKLMLHSIQYFFIGLAITLFYSLLISISEHLNFGLAYFISSLSTIALVTGYSISIINNKYLSSMVGVILTILYAFLYLLLQLEDYSLVAGSIGLFIVLALTMYFTRNVDWYSLQLQSNKTDS